VAEDSELGCLAKSDDQTIYGGANFKDNTITLYSWTTRQPYMRKKDVLIINEPNNDIFFKNLCNPDPFPIKIHFSKENVFIAINKFIFIFSKAINHTYQGVLDEHKSRITAIVESRGKLWTASQDSSIRLWEISEGKKACSSTLENAHDGLVLCMTVVGNQLVISGGGDGKIRSRSTKFNTLERENEKELFQVIHEGYIECLFWQPKSKVLWVSSLDKSISIWK